MDNALKVKILDVLEHHNVMTLATIRPDGFPQATTVNYVHDDLILFFATDAASQKARNIKLNNKVSVAIASETQDLYKLRGPIGVGPRHTHRGRAKGAQTISRAISQPTAVTALSSGRAQ